VCFSLWHKDIKFIINGFNSALALLNSFGLECAITIAWRTDLKIALLTFELFFGFAVTAVIAAITRPAMLGIA